MVTQGCVVIGIVGSEEKLKWCRDELGFDHVINYKNEDFSQAVRRIAPDGVDIYFDNVGGDYYHTIINHHMRKRGRVLVCGSIQTYNSTDAQLCKHNRTNYLYFKDIDIATSAYRTVTVPFCNRTVL